MKWLSCEKIRLLLILFMAGIVLSGGNANADYTFGEPTHLEAPINTSYFDYDACLSTDGLSLFFGSRRPGGSGDTDIWLATRPTKNDPWDTPVNLGPKVNSPYHDTDPSLSSDGLSLYFCSHRPGGSGGSDLYVTTRSTTQDMWGDAVNLGTPVNRSYNEADPSISSDDLSLYFSDFSNARPGGYGGDDLWVTTRATTSDPWGEPVNLGPLVNSAFHDCAPCLSADGLILFFDSEREGGYGNADLWFSTRKTIDDDWGTPVNLGPNVNSAYLDRDPSISSDGFSLYFGSKRPGGYTTWQLWQAPISPIVDFNGDGFIDIDDLLIMIHNWGTDETLCDIGPMPWGDGVVDEADLEVLMSYYGQEIYDPTFIAHWKLDETEGIIAYDSIRDKNGTLNGNPLWQPAGGMIDGALQLDGADDYISTPFVLNPMTDGTFSVFAWVQGGAPGQVVISQVSGANWLSADSSEGKLMTALSRPAGGRIPPSPLVSESIITDNTWHRIGLVWDGLYRRLYVDGAEVAKDAATLSGLEGSDGVLHLGAGSTLAPETFFSGLIDDVRIYNRAITP